MIQALLMAFAILITGIFNSHSGPEPWNGKPPAVFTTPGKPTAASSVRVLAAAMPRDASHVKIVTDGGTYPARPTGVRQFTVRSMPTPNVPGPWELDLRFDVHGETYSVIGAVIMVGERR